MVCEVFFGGWGYSKYFWEVFWRVEVDKGMYLGRVFLEKFIGYEGSGTGIRRYFFYKV